MKWLTTAYRSFDIAGKLACLAGFAVLTSIAFAGMAVAEPPGATALPGQTFRDCSDCPEMMVIPAGSFLMGSSDEEAARDAGAALPSSARKYAERSIAYEHPQHSVSIRHTFALGKYRVTRGEFAAFVRETGYSAEGGCTFWIDHTYPVRPEAGWRDPGFLQTDRDPVVCVSWQDAHAYIDWLNGKVHDRAGSGSGELYRLPSEAEWEYAARAGTRTARWWGDPIGSGNADCDGCGSPWDKRQPAPTGSFQANAFGISDVLGDTSEWIADCWRENYVNAPQDGSPFTIANCDLRVMRGGNWTNEPWVLRSAQRSRAKPDRRANYIGFRVARTLP
ncbi:formylglycine-generating enzyme family protein [Bradyrhizobium embrapense]|uniref:formylglycine-generating enzyme family protein n=1 Tax=Bradyrhizobium embrapense TaxID=630921 RepID=UPI000ABE26D5|nr:SUMF1/EgtB/PvdO family nonheme iron enzyme [Bradyrhizobium embrapense]